MALLMRLAEAAVLVFLGVVVILIIEAAPRAVALTMPDLRIGPLVAPLATKARGKALTVALRTTRQSSAL